MVGLPATGLGGIFYILLVAWMALRHIWISWTGRREQRRPEVRRLVILSVVMIVVVWGESLCITVLFGGLPRFGDMIDPGGTASDLVTVAIMMTPFAVLGLLLTGLHTARLLLRS